MKVKSAMLILLVLTSGLAVWGGSPINARPVAINEAVQPSEYKICNPDGACLIVLQALDRIEPQYSFYYPVVCNDLPPFEYFKVYYSTGECYLVPSTIVHEAVSQSFVGLKPKLPIPNPFSYILAFFNYVWGLIFK